MLQPGKHTEVPREVREKIVDAFKSDLATHKRNKFGEIVRVEPYRMHCIGQTRCYEKPAGSGNLWYEKDGFFTEPAGRLTKDEKGQPKFDHSAPHIEWKAPLSAPEQAAEEQRARSESLEAELQALRAEKAALEQKLTAQATKPGVKA